MIESLNKQIDQLLRGSRKGGQVTYESLGGIDTEREPLNLLLDLSVCQQCFAMVHSYYANDHDEWHEQITQP